MASVLADEEVEEYLKHETCTKQERKRNERQAGSNDTPNPFLFYTNALVIIAERFTMI